MQALGRSIACGIFLLFCVPSITKSSERDFRQRDKEAAYRAGFDSGLRDGLHQGGIDLRTRAGFGYRGRDHLRDDYYLGHSFGFKGEYKKGYRDGFRRGYREGYERNVVPQRQRRNYFN